MILTGIVLLLVFLAVAGFVLCKVDPSPERRARIERARREWMGR